MNEQNKRMAFDLARWGLAIVVGGAGWVYSVAGKSEQLDQNTRVVADHEQRIRKLEHSEQRLVRIEEKLDWIQRYMAKQGGQP